MFPNQQTYTQQCTHPFEFLQRRFADSGTSSHKNMDGGKVFITRSIIVICTSIPA